MIFIILAYKCRPTCRTSSSAAAAVSTQVMRIISHESTPDIVTSSRTDATLPWSFSAVKIFVSSQQTIKVNKGK